MNSEWPLVRLGDFCTKIGSGATPRGGGSVYLQSGETSLIRSQNIYNDGFRSGGLVYISEEDADKLKNVTVEENDVLLNITGDSVARVCLAPKEFLPSRVNQHVAIIRPDPLHFDARFLRYVLVSPKMQEYLLLLASAGATRNAITKSMIEGLEIPKPSKEIQVSIASKLESFDDKISNNSKINKSFEYLSNALFKSWFLDFEPVKAKIAALESGKNPMLAAMSCISGKNETDLDKLKSADSNAYSQLHDIASVFPEALSRSELGMIPEGWVVSTVGQIIDLAYGKALKELNRTEGNVPVYGSGGVTGTHNEYLIEGPGIIIGRKGTVGSMYYEAKDFYPIDTVFYVIPKNNVPLSYCYYTLANLKLDTMNTDAAVPGLNRNNVYRLQIPKVPTSLMFMFDKYVGEWIKLTLSLRENSKTLANIKNLLLPELLSGSLSINNNI